LVGAIAEKIHPMVAISSVSPPVMIVCSASRRSGEADSSMAIRMTPFPS